MHQTLGKSESTQPGIQFVFGLKFHAFSDLSVLVSECHNSVSEALLTLGFQVGYRPVDNFISFLTDFFRLFVWYTKSTKTKLFLN